MNLEPNSKGKTPLDYLQAAAQKLMGRGQPDEVSASTPIETATVIDKKAIEKWKRLAKKRKLFWRSKG